MKLLGIITPEESENARKLLGRKDALKDLVQVIPIQGKSEDSLYERIIEDMAETSLKIETWWKTMSKKYGWSYAASDRWYLNTESCEIFLDTDKED